MSEFDLIRRMTKRWGAPPAELLIPAGDDAALWRPSPGRQILLTSDLLVEDVHFSLKTISAWQLGAKSVAASLSDIAAMGGLPKMFLCSIATPGGRTKGPAFYEAFTEGAKAWAEAFGAYLAGGDFSKTAGPLVIDIAMTGEVEKGRELRRGGAIVGDWLLCTGYPGDSAAGLACLQNKGKVGLDFSTGLIKKHLTPVPRVLAGRWLSQNRAASACIDISDGLAAEAGHIAAASKVGFEIDYTALPVSPASSAVAKQLKKKASDWTLHGGEDYELLFTVPESKMKKVMTNFKSQTGTALSVIGRAVSKKGLWLVENGKKRSLEAKGYRHF